MAKENEMAAMTAILTLKTEMAATIKKLENLENQVATLEKAIKPSPPGHKIFGYSLYKRKTGNSIIWCARKMFKGKYTTIYIGRNKEDAEKKISEYLKNHPEKKG